MQEFKSFVITKNHPAVTDDNKLKIRKDYNKNEKMVFKFRLYDDDGNLYFSGLSSKNDTFVPLDYYGESYGCTRIDWFNADLKRWAIL